MRSIAIARRLCGRRLWQPVDDRPCPDHHQTIQADTKTIWEKFKGSWTQTKGAVKEQWGKLTDDDLLADRRSPRPARGQDPDPLRHYPRAG